MKLLSAWPRQPFLGLAISAMTGILLADSWPNLSLTVAVAVAATAVVAWFSRRSLALYAFVGLAFFLLHSLRSTGTPGLSLAGALGKEPVPITVRGAVITEPKISERDTASFLLAAESVELDGVTRPCRAKF